MEKLRSGEVCAGYGGLARAIEQVFDAEPAWFSEFDPAPSKILAHRWPAVPNYGDMTLIDWAAIEPVDVMGGGTPCQDLSGAGKRAGMTEGTRSNLWVQMREAIAIQRPKFVVWENVKGAYSATADSSMEQCPGCMGDTADAGIVLRALGRVLGDLADLGYDAEWRGLRAADVGACHPRFRVFVLAFDPRRVGREEALEHYGRSPQAHDGASVLDESDRDAMRAGPLRNGWGEYADAIDRWASVMGRPAPAPAEPSGRNGRYRLSPKFTEWMMGLPDGWITDVPGISWADQVKACGNGVVEQQAAAALRDMLASIALNRPALVAA